MNDGRAQALEHRRATAVREATFFDDPAAFRGWLEDHAARSGGIWIRFAEAGSGVEGGTLAEAVDQALAFGWTTADTVADDDDRFSLVRFLPRPEGGVWTQADRDRSRALLHLGLLAPRGRHAFDAAQADGRLAAALAPVAADDIPADLAEALAAVPEAQAFHAALDERNRSMVLARLERAPDAQTRARRIATFVEMFSAGEKLHPRRPKAR